MPVNATTSSPALPAGFFDDESGSTSTLPAGFFDEGQTTAPPNPSLPAGFFDETPTATSMPGDQPVGDTGLTGAALSFMKGAGTGTVDVLAGVPKVLQVGMDLMNPGPAVVRHFAGEQSLGDIASQPLTNIAATVKKGADIVAPTAPTLTNEVLHGVGSSLPLVAASLVPGAGLPAAAAAGASMGMENTAQRVDELRANGSVITPQQQHLAELGSGGINAATAVLPLNVAGRVASNVGGGFVKRAVAGTIGAGLEGAAVSPLAMMGENAIANQFLGENRPITEGAGKSALIGGLSNLPFGPVAAYHSIQQEQAKAAAQQARTQPIAPVPDQQPVQPVAAPESQPVAQPPPPPNLNVRPPRPGETTQGPMQRPMAPAPETPKSRAMADLAEQESILAEDQQVEQRQKDQSSRLAAPFDVLKNLDESQVNEIAQSYGIEPGTHKADTILNILEARDKSRAAREPIPEPPNAWEDRSGASQTDTPAVLASASPSGEVLPPGTSSAMLTRTTGPHEPSSVSTELKPWQLKRSELEKVVKPSNREELERARPVLRDLYPPNDPSISADEVNDPWGIHRAINRGDQIPRVPVVDLSLRHKESIRKALAIGEKVPEEVLADYPELKTEPPNAPAAETPVPVQNPEPRQTTENPQPVAPVDEGGKVQPNEVANARSTDSGGVRMPQPESANLDSQRAGGVEPARPAVPGPVLRGDGTDVAPADVNRQPADAGSAGVNPVAEGVNRQGKVGDMLSSGEQVKTSSGRTTTPFPKVNTKTDRTTKNSVIAADAWLRNNAVAEAESRGDEFNARQFKSEDPQRMPQASKDAMEEYLFGQQPDVVRPMLKPLASKPAPPAVPPVADKVNRQELERTDLIRKWGDKWQYRMQPGGKWYYSDSEQSAVESATKTYQSAPESERLTPAQRSAKADEQSYAEMDAIYGKQSLESVNRVLEDARGTKGVSPDKEFTGTGGRRTSAAVTNQGARDAGELALKLGIYVKERARRESAATKPKAVYRPVRDKNSPKNRPTYIVQNKDGTEVIASGLSAKAAGKLAKETNAKSGSVKPRNPTSPDAFGQRRKQLEDQLREAVVMETGEKDLHPKHPMHQQVMAGERSPGSLLSLDYAKKIAAGLPETSAARMALHNLQELEKNPNRTKIEKVNTNDVADGTRVVVNDSETFTIDKEDGMIRDGITSEIPEGGMNLYGKKVLPPEEGSIPEGDFAPPAETKPDFYKPEVTQSDKGIFGQDVTKPAGIGEQNPLFHEPVDIPLPKPSKDIKASKNAVDPKNTGEMFGEKDTPEPPTPVAEKSTEPPKPVSMMEEGDISMPDVSDLPIKVSQEDVPFDLARRAHEGTSFVPERRARQRQRDYMNEMRHVFDTLSPLAKTEEQKAILAAEMERYKSGYLARIKGLLSSSSRIVSTMIAGPSNFPARQMNKRSDAYGRRLNEFIEWSKRAQKAMQKAVSPESERVISSDNPDAVSLLQKKIDVAENTQRIMVEANKIIRKNLTPEEKITELQKIGLSESTAQKALEPDYMKRVGFPDFELQNNRANIKRMKSRVAELSGRSTESSEISFDGGKIVENADANRVQIVFDEKPDEATRSQLKQAGFKWAPSEGAWQRQRTGNAMDAAKRIVKPNATGDAPKTGKLDALDAWAAKKLKDLGGGTELRGGIPIDPIKDPQRLALYAIRGAVKIGKGAQRFSTWSRAMAAEFTDLTKAQLAHIWRVARRIHKLDEEGRSVWFNQQFNQEGETRPMPLIRQNTGLSDPSKFVSEMTALRASIRKAQQASKAGYQAGVEDTATTLTDKFGKQLDQTQRTALKQSLARQATAGAEGYQSGKNAMNAMKQNLLRIVRDTLPTEIQQKMIGDVAKVQSLGQLRLAVNKASELLANHDVKQALGRVEKLTGKLILDAPEAPESKSPELSEADQAEQAGQSQLRKLQRMAMKEVDINKIDPAYRDRFNTLIEEAKAVKGSLSGAKTVDEKYAAINHFNQVFGKLYELNMMHAAERLQKVGSDKVTVADKRSQIVKNIESRKQLSQPDSRQGADPKDVGFLRKWISRRAMTPQSVIMDMDGRFTADGPAGEVMLRDIRRAENAKQGEVTKFEDVQNAALEKAGYKTGTRKYSQFLTEKEQVNLPDAGMVGLTRSEQLGLYAMWKDPETRGLIEKHGRAKFNHLRDMNAAHFEMTPRDFETIARRLTPDERAIKDDFFDNYNKSNLRDRTIKAKFEMSGFAPTPHDGYFPRRVNFEKVPSAGEPLSMRQAMRALENVSQTEQRAQHDQVFLVPDFIRDTGKFIGDSSSLIHLASPVRTVRMILQHPEMKSAVRSRYGESMNREVEKFLLNLTETPDPPSADRGIMNAVHKGFYRANLTMNPRTFMSNVLGGTQMVFPMFDAKDYFPALKSAFSPKTHNEVIGASNIAANRWASPLHESYGAFAHGNDKRGRLTISEALKSVGDAASTGDIKGVFGSLSRVADAVTLMNVADAAPFNVAWEASKNEVNRLHPEWSDARKQEAILDRFHDVTMRTQNGMTPTETSGIWYDARSSLVFKGLTMLRNDANKKLNLIAQARHADPKTRVKLLGALAGNMVASAATSRLVTGVAAGLLIRALAGGEDPTEEEKRKMMTGAGNKVMDDIAGLIPGGDWLANATRAIASGTQFSFNPIPVAQPIQDTVQGGSNMRNGQIAKGLYRLTNALRTLAGDPTLPITRDLVNAWTTYHVEPADPRMEARRESAKRSQAWRDELPPEVQNLVTERNRLEYLGGKDQKDLKPDERSRFNKLRDLSIAYNQYRKMKQLGNYSVAEQWKQRMIREAGRNKTTAGPSR